MSSPRVKTEVSTFYLILKRWFFICGLYIHIYNIYVMKLVHMIMEADQTEDLQSAS